MKTAKVEEVMDIREWSGPHGTVYFHKLKMDNGDVGDAGKKTNNAIRPGDELTYELEETQHGYKIKVQQPAFGGGGFSSGFGAKKSSTASFALSYAKDLAVANINKSDKPLEMAGVADKIIETANKFQGWLKANEG